MSTTAQTPFTTEDDVLAYTRARRKDLADHLTSHGAPKNKEDQQVLLATLDGLDRSALGRLKIKADEKANAGMAGSAALIAKVLSEIGNRNIYQFEGDFTREVPVLDSSIPVPDVVEGELETNPQQTNYEEFMKKFDPENQA